jgi:hypothetical protein
MNEPLSQVGPVFFTLNPTHWLGVQFLLASVKVAQMDAPHGFTPHPVVVEAVVAEPLSNVNAGCPST